MNATAIASLTTAAGTLVLAVATFGATRSANRASKVAERSLLAGIRPLLVNSQLGDANQKIGFGDDHWVHAPGGQAVFEEADGIIYLVLSLRNAGSGIAVLQSWSVLPIRGGPEVAHDKVEDFRRQQRDFYIPSGGLGLWQGAIRDREDHVRDDLLRALRNREIITVDLHYSDMHGGQRTISRFSLNPAADDRWLAAVTRHWMLDGASPR